RLEELEREIAELTEKKTAMRAQWLREKEIITTIRDKKADSERLRADLDRAQRVADLELAARLRYGDIPAAEAAVEAAQKQLAEAQKNGSFLKEEVTDEDIAAIVSKWTGVPVSKMLEGEMAKLLHMEGRLRERVIGQEEAIVAVANAVRRARAGLGDPSRPIGSFLFLGPTGVGKTELAKALAEFLFDDDRNVVRIDMSEYMEKFAVSRLIGSPPGYVGYEEGGQLTEAVRRRPYSVVLLDEIEKAHPEVFNLLLQVLDDGRLTDSQGHVVDFRNTIVLMTSNIGSEAMGKGLSEAEEARAREAALRRAFRPEFLNRLDGILTFHPLRREHMKGILDIQLGRLRPRLEAREIELDVSAAARDWLADRGYDPVFGARPLKRLIQNELLDPLATGILNGTFRRGGKVRVALQGSGDEAKVALEAA
ncbi:MAG TPA: AAA family ATPase, partial [Nannocystaceae bacterium]|nr:AAA family ATPase [Nannocystaceae bacterium]